MVGNLDYSDIVIVVGGPNDLGPLVHSQSSQVEFDMFDFKLQECNWNHSAIMTHSILYIFIYIYRNPEFHTKNIKTLKTIEMMY